MRPVISVHLEKGYDAAITNYFDALIDSDKYLESNPSSESNGYIRLGEPFDEGFVRTFGFKLTDMLRFIKFVSTICVINPTLFYSEAKFMELSKLIDQASATLNLKNEVVEAIISYLESPVLGAEWKWYKFFGNTDSVVFKPIVRVASSRKHVYVIFGATALSRAGMLYTEYVRRELIKTEFDFIKYQNKTTHQFEQKVRDKLKQLRCQVWHVKDLPCGEIDALARIKGSKILYVIEVKSAWPSATASSIIRKIKVDSSAWETQLDERVSWFRANRDKGLARIKLNRSDIDQIVGLSHR
ncbi:MAG: hypothetical protein HYY22_01185 [Thaumarchaeota archaeon]|nr:hypothetical protein [Nitrososphaerota archaeon]